jgi:quercetin dioxygenase-like cupin family protein
MSSSHPSPVLISPRDVAVKDRGNGIRTVPLVTARTGSVRMLNGVTTLEPGSAVPKHFHNCEECVLILSGKALAHVDGVEREISPGDVSWIPIGVPHFFRNASESEPLSFFWTYASIDATRTFVASGITTRIDREHE